MHKIAEKSNLNTCVCVCEAGTEVVKNSFAHVHLRDVNISN